MNAPLTAADWLSEMYGADAPGHLILWEKSEKRTLALPATSLVAAGEAALTIGAIGEVYYGLGLQAEPPVGQSRGKGDTTCALGGVWFDIDIAGAGHAETNLPKTMDEARAFLDELPVPPTALIHTGGGFHVYFLGKHLWRFDTAADRKRVQSLSKSFQQMIVEKGSERGWKLDTTSDLARVLRLPGTFNRKTNVARPVSVMDWSGIRYDIEELERVIGVTARSSSGRSSNRQPPKKQSDNKQGNDAEARYLLQCPWVQHCVDDAASLPEPEWYSLLTLLACCSDGLEKAQDWSAGHPAYSEAETLSKFRHAQDAPGPPLCSSIHDNLNGARYCMQCKFGDRIGSPVALTTPTFALAAEYAYAIEALDFFHYKSRRRLSKEQFSDLHADIVPKAAATQVLQIPSLIRAAGYDYRPGSPTILVGDAETRINLWVNDGVRPEAGDATPFANHIAYLVPDEEPRNHLLQWLAYTVQRPAERVKHALILSGKQGTGKSYMARVLKLLHGRSNVHEVSVDELHGQFTGWLEGKQVILIEELMAQGRLELANKLKPILTQEVIRINEKHKRVYQIRNLASFFCTTNHEDPIFIEEGDRRWWFYRSPAEPLAPSYYSDLELWTTKNAGVIKSYLMDLDISGFNPNAAPPMTRDKQRLIRASLPPVEWFLKERLDDQAYPFDRDVVQLDQLFAFIRETVQNATIQQVVRALTAMGACKLARTRLSGSQVTLYAVRRAEHWVTQGQDQIRQQLEKDGLRPFLMLPAPAQVSL
jgi:hypothetical protein